MSVVEQVGKVALDSGRDQSLERLQAAKAVLADASASESAKTEALGAQLAELTELERFAEIAKIANTQSFTEPAHITVVAYALYRLGHLAELRTLAAQNSQIGVQLALAQAEYKSGNLDNARKILQDSRSSVVPEDAADVEVNLSAISALKGEEFDSDQLSTFDASFNAACYWLVRGQPSPALEELRTALSSADEEDDRQSAVLQAAFAHLLKEEVPQARQLLEQVAETSDLSKSLGLILHNNLASLQYEGSLVGAHEALKAYDDLNRYESLLNYDQRKVLNRNFVKLRTRAGLAGSTKRALAHTKAYPFDLEPEVVALNYTKSRKDISKLDTVPAKLWKAANTGKFDQKQFVKLREADLGGLLLAAEEAQSGKDHKSYFESLSKPFSRAGLALLNPEMAEIDQASIDQLVGDIDAAQLAEEVPTTESSSSVKPSRKRKRSGHKKLPADFDPSKQPNPERWLAKEDRSDFKPKKGKKNSQATQGFAGETAEVHTASQSQVVGAGAKKNKKKKGKK